MSVSSGLITLTCLPRRPSLPQETWVCSLPRRFEEALMVHLMQSQRGRVDLGKPIQSDKKCHMRSLLPQQILCVIWTEVL